MEDSKIVHYMKIPLDLTPTETRKTCFIVYSSREEHVEITIDAIESVLDVGNKYNIKRLATHGIVGHSQYSQLIELLNKCSLAIVILDGLRPNVLFEYGLLVGLRKPCIVLLEENAKIDIQSFVKENNTKMQNVKIDIDKDFSDVKDQMYVRYNYADPKKLRSLIDNELIKIDPVVEEAFMRLVFPEIDYIESEIKASIVVFSDIRKKTDLTVEDEINFRVSINEIEKLSKRHGFKLTLHYLYQKIDILARLSKYNEALLLINKLVKEYGNKTYLLSQKSKVLTKLGEIELATTCLNEALKIETKNEYLWHQKAILLERQNKKEEAILCYKKGIQCNDGCSVIHYHYGLLILDDDKDEALKQFDKALKIRSSDARYLVCRAICLSGLGKTDAARKAINDSLCFDENNVDAWYQLGLLTDSDLEAVKYFDKCLSLRQNHTGALCSKGAALSNLGEFEDACKYLINAVSLCTKHDSKGCNTANGNLARTKYMLYMTDNDKYNDYLSEAIKHFCDALASSDDLDDIEEFNNNIGYLYLVIGNTVDARTYLNNAAAINSKNNSLGSITCYNIALSYLVDGDFINAKKNLDRSSYLLEKLTSREKICYSLLVPEIIANSNVALKEKHGSPDLSKCIEIAKAVVESVRPLGLADNVLL